MSDFDKVIGGATALLARVRELNKAGAITWTKIEPPAEALDAKSWTGAHPEVSLTIVRYRQDDESTTRGSVVDRKMLMTFVYPPLSDELANAAEKACP